MKKRKPSRNKYGPPIYQGHTIFTVTGEMNGTRHRFEVYANRQDEAVATIEHNNVEFDDLDTLVIAERPRPTDQYLESLPREMAPKLPGF